MLQPEAEGHVQTLPRYSIGYTTYLILFTFFILLLSLSTRQRQELHTPCEGARASSASCVPHATLADVLYSCS